MILWMWQAPAVVLALLTWLTAAPTSLGDVARREALRRHATAKPTRVYTVVGVPNTTPPETPVTAAAPPEAKPAAQPVKSTEPPHDEKWWHARMTSAVDTRDRDQVLADALQSRINALAADIVNFDDPAKKQQAMAQRTRALDELDKMKKQIKADNDAIAAIIEDARRQGIPPGWIR